MELYVIAEQAMAVLAEFLDFFANDDSVNNVIREEARIGCDVIAASMQADEIARWSYDGYGSNEHQSLPMGVFVMTRSSIYGLHYLYNIKQVRTKTKMISIGKFIDKCEDNWNSSLFPGRYGRITHNRDERMEKWDNLSKVVHIIPTIKEHGETRISHRVDFSFEEDLGTPSRHAILPKYFEIEANKYLEWRAKIAIGCLLGFRARFPTFYSKQSMPEKTYEFLAAHVLKDCNEMVRSVNNLFEKDLNIELMGLADSVFS